MTNPSPQLVMIAGTVMSANSIEAIGPIQHKEVHGPGWIQPTFWVTTKSGHVVQWKGAKFMDTADATAEQQAHGEKCEEAAEAARAALIAAVWGPDVAGLVVL